MFRNHNNISKILIFDENIWPETTTFRETVLRLFQKFLNAKSALTFFVFFGARFCMKIMGWKYGIPYPGLGKKFFF